MGTATDSAGRPWVHAARLDPEVLTRPIREFRLPKRVRDACDRLGLRTVADVLGVEEAKFVALRGVGQRSWRRLVATMKGALVELGAREPGAPRPDGNPHPWQDAHAHLALARLGWPDPGVMIRAPRAAVMALPGVAACSYEALVANHPAGAPDACPPTSLGIWPPAFVARRIIDLPLRQELARGLAAAGVTTLGDLLGTDANTLAQHPAVTETGVADLRAALAAAFSPVDDPRARGADHDLQRLLTVLDAEDRDWIAACVGLLGLRPLPRAQLARSLALNPDQADAREARCRSNIQDRVPDLTQAWRRATESELTAQDGVVRAERLAKGPLSAMAAAAGDLTLPLRLVAFLFPGDLYLVGEVLTTVDPIACRQIVQGVHRLRHTLPRPLADLESDLLAAGLPPIRRGLLSYLLYQDAQVQIVIDSDLGEVLRRRRATVGDRLEHVLRTARSSLSIADLMFRYRDRYRRARRSRLLDNLWAEPRFVEIGPGIWDLRERHVDQAELIDAEAARVRDIICTVGGRHDVSDLIDGGPTSDRVLFLLRDCLRRDPALRSLGRGSFCARTMRVSTQMEALQHDLRSAMGELPLERFLANQHRGARDLRSRLLRENRMFVEVDSDRIDLLTNYPFNSERLRTLLRTVELHLEQNDGFDHLQGALDAVTEAGLGGEFLTMHMFGDILRRHSRFEMLADELIALRTRGLRSWIQQRSREAIRRAAQGLTAFEIQAEVPELAQFAACLESVIADDPMVQMRDGLHYRVV